VFHTGQRIFQVSDRSGGLPIVAHNSVPPDQIDPWNKHSPVNARYAIVFMMVVM